MELPFNQIFSIQGNEFFKIIIGIFKIIMFTSLFTITVYTAIGFMGNIYNRKMARNILLVGALAIFILIPLILSIIFR